MNIYDGEKSENDKERDKITITGSTSEEKETETKEEETNEEEENENEEVEGEKDEEKETDKEEETKELSDEQKQIAKLTKTIERLTKRVDKTSGERNETRKELATAKAALDAKLVDGEIALSEEEVERRAEIKANDKMANAEFNRAQAKLIKDATKIDNKFMSKVNEMADEVGQLPGYMIGILEELDNGGAVLNYLTDNVEEYEDIHMLPPGKMALKLGRIADKLEAATKPKPKPISKAPAPNEPIKGGNKSPNILTGKESMDDFVRIRNEQTEARRKAKLR